MAQAFRKRFIIRVSPCSIFQKMGPITAIFHLVKSGVNGKMETCLPLGSNGPTTYNEHLTAQNIMTFVDLLVDCMNCSEYCIQMGMTSVYAFTCVTLCVTSQLPWATLSTEWSWTAKCHFLVKVSQESCDVTHSAYRQAYTPVMSMHQKAVRSTDCTSCNQPAGRNNLMLYAVKC